MGKHQHRLEWSEVEMFPAKLVRAELVVHLDEGRQTVTLGWKITEGLQRSLVAQGVSRPSRALEDIMETGAAAMAMHRRALDSLSPFPGADAR